MTLEIMLPLLVCIIGALGYALSANTKVGRLSELAYLAGLLVTLYEVATHIVRL